MATEKPPWLTWRAAATARWRLRSLSSSQAPRKGLWQTAGSVGALLPQDLVEVGLHDGVEHNRQRCRVAAAQPDPQDLPVLGKVDLQRPLQPGHRVGPGTEELQFGALLPLQGGVEHEPAPQQRGLSAAVGGELFRAFL